MTTRLSRRTLTIFLCVMGVVWALRAFRPDWWVVPYAVGLGFAIEGVVEMRRRGACWRRAVLRSLVFGVAIGVLVYLPPVLLP